MAQVMKWVEITIRTTEEASDAITEMLAQIGADGIACTDPYEFRNTIENDPLSYCDDGTIESYGEDVIIKAYFAELDGGYFRMGPKSEEFVDPNGVGMIYGNITNKTMTVDEAIAYIKKRLAEIGEFLDIGAGFEGFTYVKDEDWANNWKKYYTAFKISDRVAVCPSWIDPATIDSEYKIILDPGSAFGTGTHETTSMCAEILDKYLPAGADVLDLGTGSGILAIIARLLGAGKIEAVDIDSLAVRVAEDNCKINGCEDIDCYTGELKSVKRSDYDVIVANIIADIIAEIACDVPARLKSGGLFICSGIVNTKAERVEKALALAGLEILASEEKNDWRAYVCRKP